jgi:phytanoyl-CoA hydroxylase
MLTPEEVRFFHDNGYLIMRGLLPERDILALRAAVDRLQTDAIDKLRQPGYLSHAKHLNKDWIEHEIDHYVYRQKPDGSYSFHRIERGYTQDPIFAQTAMSPRLLTPAWQVLERPFWPRAGNVVVKLPHEGAEVRWHQDIPYLYWSSGGHPGKGRSTTHPIPNFNTDIYLESSTRDNGCLWAIPGSHRSGTVDVDRMVAEQGWYLKDAVPLELEPGDVMFHHVALVHGSPENRSPVLRRTFYIHYLTDETVRDAYADWPDLKSPDESQAFWGEAMAARRAAVGEENGGDMRFRITPEGIRPA